MCCEGAANYALVSALSNASNKGPFSPSITGTLLLDPNGDSDLDGMTNAAQTLGGTYPHVHAVGWPAERRRKGLTPAPKSAIVAP